MEFLWLKHSLVYWSYPSCCYTGPCNHNLLGDRVQLESKLWDGNNQSPTWAKCQRDNVSRMLPVVRCRFIFATMCSPGRESRWACSSVLVEHTNKIVSYWFILIIHGFILNSIPFQSNILFLRKQKYMSDLSPPLGASSLRVSGTGVLGHHLLST